MVEVVAGGHAQRSQAYYANDAGRAGDRDLRPGQVAHAKTRRPLPGVYVKVYAVMDDGEVKFYKDGYTDLRGRFDYASLNAAGGRPVERFSILVLHDEHGAVIRETEPPKS